MKRLLIILFLIAPMAFATTVYKSRSSEGAVEYTDKPKEGAEAVELDPVQSMPVPPSLPQSTPIATPQDGTEAGYAYQGIAIMQPVNDAVVRDNAGEVQVTVEVHPRLYNELGHRIAVRLDDRLLALRMVASQFTLKNIDRGAHQLQIVIVDNEGATVAESAAITFHMKRHSILFPRPNS